MAKQTALYQAHIDAGGQIVEFGGWSMPVNYGSQIAEHVAVRTDAGMFDVSHMTPVDITGEDAREFLRFLLANDVASIDPISCMVSTNIDNCAPLNNNDNIKKQIRK